MTEFIINMSTEDKSDIYPEYIESIYPIKNKNSDELINLVENYFFRFSPKDIKARKDSYYEGPGELDALREIFRRFMVYEESQKVIINTCSTKPVDLYISTFKRLLTDLESDNPNWDSSNPLFKNTADVVMNDVLEMHYRRSMLVSASKKARLAFATWTNPMYLISS